MQLKNPFSEILSNQRDAITYGRNTNILDFVGKNKKVLDVGCGWGRLAEQLSKFNQCQVYGIETNPQAAKKAAQYCTLVDVDIEAADKINCLDRDFDVILFADVLEHLKNPDTVLTRLQKHLKPSGYVVCSIPNVAHVTVRFRLLFGEWNYTPGGILDVTHLRFFTRKSATGLLSAAGLSVSCEGYSPYFTGRLSGRLLNQIIKLLPSLCAYQFIIKAVPSEFNP